MGASSSTAAADDATAAVDKRPLNLDSTSDADGGEWNDRLALAQDDELDDLAARLEAYKPTRESLQAEAAAQGARDMARGELGEYLDDLKSKTNEDGEAAVLFPADFSALVADLFKTKIRDELKAAVSDVKGKGVAAAADDDEGGKGSEGGGTDDGGRGSSSAPPPDHHNPEYDLDPKIVAGLERIKRLDKQLFSKSAEAAIVRREVYPEKYFDPVDGHVARARRSAEEDIHREKSRRKKLAKLRRALRGEAASEMGGAAARNAAAVGAGDHAMAALARRFLQLSPEEDALAEKLLADFELSGGFDDVGSVATSAVTGTVVGDRSKAGVGGAFGGGSMNGIDEAEENPFEIPTSLGLLAAANDRRLFVGDGGGGESGGGGEDRGGGGGGDGDSDCKSGESDCASKAAGLEGDRVGPARGSTGGAAAKGAKGGRGGGSVGVPAAEVCRLAEIEARLNSYR
jgi:prefoldin subunit 5